MTWVDLQKNAFLLVLRRLWALRSIVDSFCAGVKLVKGFFHVPYCLGGSRTSF